jgi:serine/threonine protein kinase
VDEAWNVKVADFGFARIKEENATMTRCGTPCWTAPEVIRGEKYSEKADVYSFGVVMWEVLTRKLPYADHTFMSVALEILDGKRPEAPAECPPFIAKLMQRCWHKVLDLLYFLSFSLIYSLFLFFNLYFSAARGQETDHGGSEC